MKTTKKTGKTQQQAKSASLFRKYQPNYRIMGVLAGVIGVVGAYLSVASNAATTVATITSPPAKAILSNVALQDTTVMQSFAYDAPHKVWIFAQVSQGGRLGYSGAENSEIGNLTLTKVSATGKNLGYMYLKGFGHGVSIGVEPVGVKTFVWVEAGPTENSAGSRIARIEWKDGATVTTTSAGVTVYGVNAGATNQTPYVDAASNRIAVRYYSTTLSSFRWAVYPLDKFKARDYTALARVTQPITQQTPKVVPQGWALNGASSILSLSGAAYDATNVKPGNTTIYNTDIASGVQTGQVLVTALPTMTHREPEGLSIINGNVCVGFASGASGARRANIVCQRAI